MTPRSMKETVRKNERERKRPVRERFNKFDKIKNMSYDILNSKVLMRQQNTIEQLAEMVREMKLEKIEYPTYHGDKEGPILRVEKFEDSNKQDAYVWTDRFRKVMLRCKYSEEEAIEELFYATNNKYHELFQKEKKFEKCLIRLIEESYNVNTFDRIVKELKGMSVGKFNNVREYFDAFRRKVEKSDFCVSKDDRLTLREKNELLKMF